MLPSGQHKAAMMAVLRPVFAAIRGRALDETLEFVLNRNFGIASSTHESLVRLLQIGLEEGWVAYAPVPGADYSRGRIADPSDETVGLSVESGLLYNVKGQYHRHTRGEIDMIVPIDSSARWCGHEGGWVVYPPMSEHFPTATGGKLLALYFLPNGEIEYRAPPPQP
jgi:hypothetical protein